MASQKLTQYNFPVKLMPLKTETGLKTSSFGVVRTDTKKVLGVVGDKYNYIPHKRVIDKIENTLPVTVANRTIELAKGGAIMIAKYETAKIDQVEVRKGDIVKFRVDIINSYDGTYPVSLRLSALRLACLNGMTIPKSLISLSFRHTSGADIINARKQFNEKIKLYTKSSDLWKKWAETKLSYQRAEKFLNGKMPYKYQDAILLKFQAEKDDTVWGLYNAFTFFTTHTLTAREKNYIPIKRFRFQTGHEKFFYMQNWN